MTSRLPELPQAYEPDKFEGQVYDFWEKGGFFEAKDECSPGQDAFCIVIPPPNVTGVLHMGHALGNSIQDAIIRWRRMKGDNALWLPGTDHAGISTQVQVEKALAKEKSASGRPLSRHDIGREDFLKRTWKWKEEHGGRITAQTRRLGCSLDWRRERFTLDEGLSRAVREVFVRLHEEGLIYRGERIINWCTRCQTALSDLEVEPADRKGMLWRIRYRLAEADGSPAPGGEALVVATTRPETLLGDTAVAVHPEDDRFRAFHGKKVLLPLLGRQIPVIVDPYVDREFGTGALKITPAHDFNDYEIGKKHDLPSVSVVGKDGRITSAGGPYAGLKLAEARERVVLDLKQGGLLDGTEAHANRVGLCQRCDQVAEPIVSQQWFVKVAPLAKPAIEAVRSGQIEFVPKAWEKTYFEWMENIRDWCVSRQLWWGHQIPAWYCAACQATTVARKDPEKCASCGAPATELRRDEDVLDTWFSSALWPFSTLGWPDRTAALKTFYPTSVMETGFDIIFFWVARMIMMGLKFMGDVPFRKVYLHAMVRDEKGHKMSKSRGNVIDPLDVIDKQGCDPLRFTLLSMAGQGRDIKLSLDRVEGYRAFCNKLWNAARFFRMQSEDWPSGLPAPEPRAIHGWLESNRARLRETDRWILGELARLERAVERSLQGFEVDVAAKAVYDFAWHELCDWYIELAKLGFRDSARRPGTVATLYFALERFMRVAHPFLPFATEMLWQNLPGTRDAKALIAARWPDTRDLGSLADAGADSAIATLKVCVEAIRAFRGANAVAGRIELPAKFWAESTDEKDAVARFAGEIRALGRLSSLDPAGEPFPAGAGLVLVPGSGIAFSLEIAGVVDVDGESRRLEKEIAACAGDIAHVRAKLSKESFIAKAPPELVAKERAKEADLVAKQGELEAALARLRK